MHNVGQFISQSVSPSASCEHCKGSQYCPVLVSLFKENFPVSQSLTMGLIWLQIIGQSECHLIRNTWCQSICKKIMNVAVTRLEKVTQSCKPLLYSPQFLLHESNIYIYMCLCWGILRNVKNLAHLHSIFKRWPPKWPNFVPNRKISCLQSTVFIV